MGLRRVWGFIGLYGRGGRNAGVSACKPYSNDYECML